MVSKASKKMELIEAVQECATFWDVVAKSDAIESVRFPKDRDKQERAKLSVGMADAAHRLEQEVIELIHQYWASDSQ